MIFITPMRVTTDLLQLMMCTLQPYTVTILTSISFIITQCQQDMFYLMTDCVFKKHQKLPVAFLICATWHHHLVENCHRKEWNLQTTLKIVLNG